MSPTLVAAEAEGKALQGCNLSADFGARPGLGELGSPKPAGIAGTLGWQEA